MALLLKGLRWLDEGNIKSGDIRIRKEKITEIGVGLTPKKDDLVIQFTNHYLYPGLINSHDHLEMNLYPQMGNPPYPNYISWGNDIYKPELTPIKEIEKIDLKDRLLWGGIKNLISGATTVVHHNPWKNFLSSKHFPVKVLKKYAWAHSLAFGKELQKSFSSNSSIPFIIHAAEGIDDLAKDEITALDSLQVLRKNTVLIHGVSLTDDSIAVLEKNKVSLVWCPASNHFLFNQTTPLSNLKKKIKISLGTDSTLTGSDTLFREMLFALKTDLATEEEIYNYVTVDPATIFNLPIPKIAVNDSADLFILPARHFDYFKNLVQSESQHVELVCIDGYPKFSSEDIAKDLRLKKYFITINGSRKWISTDVEGLKKRIEKTAGPTVYKNPLWQLIE